MSLENGQRIGDYCIIGILGAGASAQVFKAEHVITRRAEALKVLTRRRPDTPEEEERFLREIQVQASLDHPNIASLYTAFWTADSLVLALELVEGEPFDAVLARGRLPARAGIGIVLQVLAALEFAHGRGVVHRDIKPENILVTRDGVAKLTDFGIARQAAGPRLTATGELAGSPYYMSPEQVVGIAPADARSDVYSVGAMLYEVLTGHPPFESASAFEIMLAHRDSAPKPPIEIEPAIGPALNEIVLKALEKDPGRRFQSAEEFRFALEAATGGVSAHTPVQRRRWKWVAAAVLVAAAALVLALAGTREPQTPPATALPPTVRQHRPTPAPRVAATVPAAAERAPAASRVEPRGKGTAPVAEPPARVEDEKVTAEPEATTPEAAPKKRRNRFWRALGRVAHPWRSSDPKPAGKGDEPAPTKK